MPTTRARVVAVRIGSFTPGGQLLDAEVSDALGMTDSAGGSLVGPSSGLGVSALGTSPLGG